MISTVQTAPDATTEPVLCHRCHKPVHKGRGFSFKAPNMQPPSGNTSFTTEIIKCFPCALQHRPMLKRSFAAAFVVGTVLTLLNHGDTLMFGQWTDAWFWKIPLTYCVPLAVATYGALTNSRK